MRGWGAVLHWVHDNIFLIFFGAVVVLFVAAWLIAEAFRSHQNRDELVRLRHRVHQMERDQAMPASFGAGPIVLSPRWLIVGSAATTTDGGCFILLEAAWPLQRRAMLTVRVDGLPSQRNASVTVGETIEASGKSGIYSIELHAAESNQARLAISLRAKHAAV